MELYAFAKDENVNKNTLDVQNNGDIDKLNASQNSFPGNTIEQQNPREDKASLRTDQTSQLSLSEKIAKLARTLSIGGGNDPEEMSETERSETPEMLATGNVDMVGNEIKGKDGGKVKNRQNKK